MQSTIRHSQISPFMELPSATNVHDRRSFYAGGGVEEGGVVAMANNKWTPINGRYFSKPPQYDTRNAEGRNRSLEFLPRHCGNGYWLNSSERPEDHMQPQTGQGAERALHHHEHHHHNNHHHHHPHHPPCGVTPSSSSPKQATPFAKNTKRNYVPEVPPNSGTEDFRHVSLPPMLNVPLQASIKPAPSPMARPLSSEYKKGRQEYSDSAHFTENKPCILHSTSPSSSSFDSSPLTSLSPLTLPSPSPRQPHHTKTLHHVEEAMASYYCGDSSCRGACGQYQSRGYNPSSFESSRPLDTTSQSWGQYNYEYTARRLPSPPPPSQPAPSGATGYGRVAGRSSHPGMQLPPIAALLNFHRESSPPTYGYRQTPTYGLAQSAQGPAPSAPPPPPPLSSLGPLPNPFGRSTPLPSLRTYPQSNTIFSSGSPAPARLQAPSQQFIPTPEQSRRPSDEAPVAGPVRMALDFQTRNQEEERAPIGRYHEERASYQAQGYGVRQISRRTISESEKRARKAAQQQHRRKYGPTREARERFSRAEDKWLVMEKRRLEKEPNKHWTDLERAHKAKFPEKNFRTLSGLQSRYYRIKKKYEPIEQSAITNRLGHSRQAREELSSWDREANAQLNRASRADGGADEAQIHDAVVEEDFNSEDD